MRWRTPRFPVLRRGCAQNEVESQHEAGDDRQTEVGDKSRVGFLCSRRLGNAK